MIFLVDTNVVSELRKPAPHPSVRAWAASVRGADLFLSVLTVGEIRQGIERLRPRDRRRADVLEQWLGALRRDYADRIVPISMEVAEEWGRLNVPVRLPVVDGLLAATAGVHEMILVTRNGVDVRRTGVRVLDPFDLP